MLTPMILFVPFKKSAEASIQSIASLRDLWKQMIEYLRTVHLFNDRNKEKEDKDN